MPQSGNLLSPWSQEIKPDCNKNETKVYKKQTETDQISCSENQVVGHSSPILVYFGSF